MLLLQPPQYLIKAPNPLSPSNWRMLTGTFLALSTLTRISCHARIIMAPTRPLRKSTSWYQERCLKDGTACTTEGAVCSIVDGRLGLIATIGVEQQV